MCWYNGQKFKFVSGNSRFCREAILIKAFVFFEWLLQTLQGPGLSSSVRNRFYTDSWTPRTSDKPIARPLPTQDNVNIEYSHTQTPMP
jgi:hypothetical protein